jgi:hypothetical protein
MTNRNLRFIQNDQNRNRHWSTLEFCFCFCCDKPHLFLYHPGSMGSPLPIMVTYSFLSLTYLRCHSPVELGFYGSTSFVAISWLTHVYKIPRESVDKSSLNSASHHRSTHTTFAQNCKVGSCLDVC